jgi:hypothetical protein
MIVSQIITSLLCRRRDAAQAQWGDLEKKMGME